MFSLDALIVAAMENRLSDTEESAVWSMVLYDLSCWLSEPFPEGWALPALVNKSSRKALQDLFDQRLVVGKDSRPLAALRLIAWRDLAETVFRHQASMGPYSQVLISEISTAAMKFLGRHFPALGLRDREDIKQEFLVWLLENYEQYDPARPFLPYMCGVLKNRALAWISKRERRQNLLDEHQIDLQLHEDGLGAPSRFARGVLIRRVADALEQLRREDEEIVNAYIEVYVFGQSLEEVARRLGISRSTLRDRLQKFIQKLAVLLGENPPEGP